MPLIMENNDKVIENINQYQAVDIEGKCYLLSVCRIEWMMGYQGMVCLAGSTVWWTWEVEDVFHKVRQGIKTAMKEYAKKQHKQIDELVVQIRSPLNKNDRSKFNTVLIIDVHARDIIDGFVRDRYFS